MARRQGAAFELADERAFEQQQMREPLPLALHCKGWKVQDQSMSKANENGGKKFGHRFEKGHKKVPGSGRPRGQKNHLTLALKDAIVAAAEYAGQKKLNKETGEYTLPGRGGLLGFLQHLALHREELFTPMLSRVLPMHIGPAATMTNNKFKTESEVRELCRAHGLPFASVLDLSQPAPRSMLDVTPVPKIR